MDSGSKSRRRKSTNWPTNGLESLPCEVALDILSRLPITSLTRCSYLDQRVLAGFGFHPLTNEYKVVRIIYYQNVHNRYSHSVPVHSESEVQVYSMDSNNWRLIGKISYQVERWPSELLLVNGRLHWLCRFDYGGEYCRKIISFDLADELFREVPTPEWGGIRSYHPLAILGGCLCMLVYPHFRNLEIWVMKEYGVRESWSKNFEIDVNCPHPRGSHMWSTSLKSLACQVLCLMKNGGILLMHDGNLASCDPDRRELKNVMFKGMPSSFQVVLHEGSLVWI